MASPTGPDSHNWSPAAPGDCFGLYELVACVGVDRLGQRWRVRCACGVEREFSLAYLRHRARTGEPMCRRCSLRRLHEAGLHRVGGRRSYARKVGDKEAFSGVGASYDPLDDLPETW